MDILQNKNRTEHSLCGDSDCPPPQQTIIAVNRTYSRLHRRRFVRCDRLELILNPL